MRLKVDPETPLVIADRLPDDDKQVEEEVPELDSELYEVEEEYEVRDPDVDSEVVGHGPSPVHSCTGSGPGGRLPCVRLCIVPSSVRVSSSPTCRGSPYLRRPLSTVPLVFRSSGFTGGESTTLWFRFP